MQPAEGGAGSLTGNVCAENLVIFGYGGMQAITFVNWFLPADTAVCQMFYCPMAYTYYHHKLTA
jgi:hypothetical protein